MQKHKLQGDTISVIIGDEATAELCNIEELFGYTKMHDQVLLLEGNPPKEYRVSPLRYGKRGPQFFKTILS